MKFVLLMIMTAAACHSQSVPPSISSNSSIIKSVSSGSVVIRLCDNRIVKSGIIYKNEGVDCIEPQSRSIKGLSVVSYNPSDKPVYGVITFRAIDQMNSAQVGEDIVDEYTALPGVHAYGITDIFATKESQAKLARFISNVNPIMVTVEFVGEGSTKTRGSGIIGTGRRLELSLNAVPVMPAVVFGGEDVNYKTLGPSAMIKAGMQYITDTYKSLGGSLALLVKSSGNENSNTDISVWPALSASISSYSTTGNKYALDIILAYDPQSEKSDNLIVGAGLNFGIDFPAFANGNK